MKPMKTSGKCEKCRYVSEINVVDSSGKNIRRMLTCRLIDCDVDHNDIQKICSSSPDTVDINYIYYLASPYTHESHLVMQSRHRSALMAVIELQKFGYTVFSPIVNGVPVEKITGNNDLDHWLEIDKKFIRKLDGVIVLAIKGWETSQGVLQEIDFAREIGKPVFVYNTYDATIVALSGGGAALQYGGG